MESLPHSFVLLLITSLTPSDMVVGSVKTWSPQRFAVTYNDHENANEYAAIALNVPIRRPAIFAKVWNGGDNLGQILQSACLN